MFPRFTIRRRVRSLVMCLLAAAIAIPVSAVSTDASAASSLPCDIYAAGGTPCVAAYSTTRSLFAAYGGPLYQIQRSSDKSYLDVGVLAAGGYANAAAQVSFCSGTTCTITKLYDQSSKHNDLPISWIQADVGANAMALPVTVNGNAAYGVKVLNTSAGAVGYRNFNTQGVPTGSQPEGIYEVTSTALYNSSCCFDFGSAENGWRDDGDGTMNAIEFGSACWFGGCTGPGPWVEADLEQGMYSSVTGPNNPSNPGITYPFVSAWEKNNGTSNFTLKYGNADSGGLTTTYSGALPSGGYSPMRLENSVLLGTGGGNDHGDTGEFFEGAVTAGYPTDATENAVQASLTAAGYGRSSSNIVTVTNPGNQSAASGTPITAVQIHATDSASGQTLTYSATGLPPGLSISSSGLISGTPNGGGTFTPIVTATDTTGAIGSTSFTWTVSGNPASSPLHAVGAGKCLDDPNSSTSGGTQQQIWDCNGGAGQNWTHTSSNQLTLSVGGSTFCLDANGQGTSNGTKAIIWSCDGQANQQWNINSNGTITGQQSGLCLDVNGASTANGALVQLWSCNGGSNQQWKLG